MMAYAEKTHWPMQRKRYLSASTEPTEVQHEWRTWGVCRRNKWQGSDRIHQAYKKQSKENQRSK